MKIFYTIIFIVIQGSFGNYVFGQSDTVEWFDEEHYSKIYNPYTNSVNSSYDYSNKYDFDGDNINDSLLLIGNGGAHVYYYLKIVLSSDNIERNFPTVQMDFVYEATKKELENIDSLIQIGVYDFDDDGKNEIYLNFNNDFSTIPNEWKEKGIKSKRVMLNFENHELTCTDYIE